MPFVRYARDRRGYETLYVMHAFEGEGAAASAGNSRSARVRVLYACRTVPYAKVGRMTIDESVQRRIETAYPKLTFDWPKLLKEAAQSAPRPERPDARQEQRRGRAKKKEPRVPRVPQVPLVPKVRFEVPEVQGSEVQGSEVPEPEVHEAQPEALEPVTELIEWTAVDEASEPEPEPEPMEPRTEPMEPMEPREPVEPGEIGSLFVDRAWPVVGIIGEDRALVLRGRYIELAHRVLSRVNDPGEQRRLFREADRLNPEAWQTDEQARAGIAAFEEVYSRLAEQLRRQRPL